MIDLRAEMAKIIEENGHYVLLQRASRRIRCICWDEKYQESSVRQYIEVTKYKGPQLAACPRCLGRGWISRIERHKVRRDNASQIIGLPDLIKQTDPGQLASDARVFWMKYDVAPRIGDFIYEVGWDGQRPTHLIRSYQVSHADDLRGDRGRVEYYQVVCKEANIDTTIKSWAIRRLGPVANYEALRGAPNV